MSICLILDMEKTSNKSVGRPQKCRFVKSSPLYTYYKPVGISMSTLENISITIDEIEAIRLADYNGLYHEKAAQKMGISRQTFSRILASAHKKISDGIINGKSIQIIGGNYNINNTQSYNCTKCKHHWEKEFRKGRIINCPNCGSSITKKRNF